MTGYITRRLLYSALVLLVASFVAFAGVRATFDPLARFAQVKDQEVKQREIERLGLDRPLVVQYTDYMKDFVRGDWGEAELKREPVSTIIWRGMGNTLQLIVWGVLISLLVAVTTGVYSAVKQYSIPDYTLTAAAFIGIAMPSFWFGLIAIQFLGVQLKEWLDLDEPVFFFLGLHSVDSDGINLDYARHLVLPVLTLTVQIIASWMRFQRAAMLDVLGADYVRTARAKGVPRRRVIFHHAFRNATIPMVTVVALDIGLLFGGLIVTEQIFSIKGMGSVFLDALQSGDARTLTAWTVVTAAFVVVFNLIADVLYGVLDPRVRLQ